MTLRQLIIAIVGAVVAAGVFVVIAPATKKENDDRYAFRDAPIELPLARSWGGDISISWPDSAEQWDTALLGLRVHAERKQEPWLELRAGSSRIEQYLDRKASGLRWINLSRLKGLLSKSANLEIVGHGVTILGPQAELRLFANPVPDGPTLILSPHPDDAEIAAFGLYNKTDATIVTVTAGNSGGFKYRREISDPAEHYRFKGFLRSVDSVWVPWLGGIPPDRTYNLGYFDSRLRQMHRKPKKSIPEKYSANIDIAVYRRANIGDLLPNGPRTNSWVHLVEDLATIIRKVHPARIVMPHPLLDDNLDHRYTTVAAVEALKDWPEPVQILLYTNHASKNRYPFGPAGTAMSLPPWSSTTLPVQNIYSHPLSAEVQRWKLFALESMHDLRLSPADQATCVGQQPDKYNYFRRAVRPDEIFFRYDLTGARQVVDSLS
jgi:LmbE family N-acetylglucosaminyl deacetylase